jgi:predicted nucleic acid-binding protein
VRFTLDTNILIYPLDSSTPDKQAIARDLMRRSRDADIVLTAQALGEFVNVVRRKYASLYPVARAQAERWSELFPVAATNADVVMKAAEFGRRYKLQFWDSVIWQAARSADATIFITEDLQDGLSIDGMTVIHPFKPANAEALNVVLASTR